jgi:hypothetical protein
MSTSTDKEVARIADQIEHYLEEHPHAADTLEGIAEWWLQAKRQNVTMKATLLALNSLVTRGVLVKITDSNGKWIYRRAQHREPEERLVKG